MAAIDGKERVLFSVMTINIRFGFADDGEHSWDKRKHAFFGLFEKYRPDFVCMQEVNRFQADFLRRLLPGYGSTGWREDAPERWQDVPIFHDKGWICLKSRRFFLSDTPDIPSRMPKSRWPRQCVMAEFAHGKSRVVVANTHFDFDEEVQAKSAAIVLAHLEGFATPGAPTIITGDFNASPESRCHQVFTDPKAPGGPFFDVFSNDDTGTHHGFTGKPLSDRIDWILWRNMKPPVERALITESFDNTFPSDHFPVYAEFEIGL